MKQILKKIYRFRGIAHDHTSSAKQVRLFIHIPKTAGTSFRTAAESRFGKSHVLRDYGTKAAATSRSILESVYESGDRNDILKVIEDEQSVLLAGHFPVQKYGRLIGLPNTVTFFRDPVDQVVSHYRHAVTHLGYKDCFLAFARLEKIRNIQTRFTFNLDPCMFGIVGLTDRYRESLDVINERWRWKLRHRRKNVSDRFDRHGLDVSAEDRAEVERLNREDRILFRRARRVFENSFYCLQNNIPSDPRGMLNPVTSGETISGWSIDVCLGRKMSVTLVRNGEPIASSNCTEPISTLKQWKLPGTNRAGFVFHETIAPGDHIALIDATTGLVLDEQTANEVKPKIKR